MIRLLTPKDEPLALIVIDFPGGRRHGDIRDLVGRTHLTWNHPIAVYELPAPVGFQTPPQIIEAWLADTSTVESRTVYVSFCASRGLANLMAQKAADSGALVAGIIHLDPTYPEPTDIAREIDAIARGAGTTLAARQDLECVVSTLRPDDSQSRAVIERVLLDAAGEMQTATGLSRSEFQPLLDRWLGWTSFLLACFEYRDFRSNLPTMRVLAADSREPVGAGDTPVDAVHDEFFRHPSTHRALVTAAMDVFKRGLGARNLIAT